MTHLWVLCSQTSVPGISHWRCWENSVHCGGQRGWVGRSIGVEDKSKHRDMYIWNQKGLEFLMFFIKARHFHQVDLTLNWETKYSVLSISGQPWLPGKPISRPCRCTHQSLPRETSSLTKNMSFLRPLGDRFNHLYYQMWQISSWWLQTRNWYFIRLRSWEKFCLVCYILRPSMPAAQN